MLLIENPYVVSVNSRDSDGVTILYFRKRDAEMHYVEMELHDDVAQMIPLGHPKLRTPTGNSIRPNDVRAAIRYNGNNFRS